MPAVWGSIRDVQKPLCETEHYWVEAHDESVVLSGPGVPDNLIIGDFYGNPREAMIDAEERWCVMVGCGLIVYRLGDPWTPYRYSRPPDGQVPMSLIHRGEQWWEYGREREDAVWLDSIDPDRGERFVVAGQTSECQRRRWEVLAGAAVVRPLDPSA